MKKSNNVSSRLRCDIALHSIFKSNLDTARNWRQGTGLM